MRTGDTGEGETVLEISGLHMIFGGLTALSDVDLAVRKNEIYGLLGPNGAGKTTLFNVVAGVYRPTRGTIVFNGKVINGLRPDQRCNLGIARTFQITQPIRRADRRGERHGRFNDASPEPTVHAAGCR